MNLVHVSSLALHQFITTISFFEDCGNYAFCSVFNALIGMLNQGSYRSFHILLCPIYVLLLCMCYAMLAGLGVMIHCILFMCTALLVPFIASHTLHNNILLLIYQAWGPVYHLHLIQGLCRGIACPCFFVWISIVCWFLQFLHLISLSFCNALLYSGLFSLQNDPSITYELACCNIDHTKDIQPIS